MDARKARGQKTKEKMLEAAASLFQKNGVNGTSVDDVLGASSTGKSQFYHYFGSKDRLVRDVLRYHADEFRSLGESLKHVESFEQFEQWIEFGKDKHMKDECFYGCPVGMMANELSLSDEELRLEIEQVFAFWKEMFARCFACLKAKGELVESSDPDELAEFFVVNFQGASLLAKTQQDQGVLLRSLKSSVLYLQSFRS